jgi:hypothetical protein
MTDEKKTEEQPEDPHGTPRKADDDNAQVPQDPMEDHGGGDEGLEGGDEATGTGPSGGGDPGVPEH